METAAPVPPPGKTLVALDELPFGNFVEIEGPTGAAIQTAADLLGVDWEARIMKSYLELFMVLQKRMDLKFRDLTFENFRGLDISPEALGVRSASK